MPGHQSTTSDIDAALARSLAAAQFPQWAHRSIEPVEFDGWDNRTGDPAFDAAIAWTFFHGESRHAFQSALPMDNITWARGRAWALWKALIILADQDGTNPLGKQTARQTLTEILGDQR